MRKWRLAWLQKFSFYRRQSNWRRAARSSLVAGGLPGEYRLNVKSDRVGGADNLAALFNIRVVDDDLVEEEEEIDITIAEGAGFPDDWTLRKDVVYRLTVPADADDTDGNAIAWEAPTSGSLSTIPSRATPGSA